MSSSTQSVPVCVHRVALDRVRENLRQQFLERDAMIDAMITALLARQHVLLLGPPGTAKSALVSALCSSIDGAQHFQWLLTKFSTPEEMFGPISLTALQQDRVARITTNKLPEAHIAFCDEIFKANSAILNALLTLINERAFHNDGRTFPCPLITMVGASNELPEGAELEALFDRFLLRFWLSYLADASNVRALLTHGSASNGATITLDQLRACQTEADQINVPDTIIDAIIAIKTKVEEAGFTVSDRRWKQTIAVLKAAAYLAGETDVSEEQLDLLPDMLWREPKDRPSLAAIVGSVGNPLNVKATEILDAAKEALAKLGSPNKQDPSAKAEWLKEASLVESRLGAMRTELDDILVKHPSAKTRRVKDVLQSLDRMKRDITGRVAALYNL